jgi:hypothetical protein
MDVRLPDGTVIKNVPEGTTKQQLLDKLKAKGYDVQKLTAPKAAAPEAAPSAPEESFGQRALGAAASTADIIAESVPGMAAMVAYPFRRAAGVVTGETAEDIAASQERVMGAVQAPVGRALGVEQSPSYQNNMIRQALGYVAANMDKGADWISDTTGIPKPDVVNMMQVAATAVPVKVPGAKTAGKIKGRVVETARNVMDPKTKFYMDLAEGRGAALVSAARAPEAEIIPGVRPTFAQATADVGVPRVAAVGEQAARKLPTEAVALRDVQEAGRVGRLRAIERTPERRKLAETVRERRADPLYKAAETAGDVVDVTPALTFIDDTIRKNPGNQPLLVEMRRLRRGLVKPGRDPQGNPILVPRTNAKEVSSTIDGLKSAIAKEDNKFIKGELTQIKDELTAAIPSMKEAQAAFKKGSKPINQMDVGKFLREKLESAVPEGTQRAGVFAEAVRNAPLTIKRALDGQPRYEKLTDVLSPAQKANVDRVLMDLSRDQRVKELAQAGRSEAPQLGKTVEAQGFPNLLNRLTTIANEVIRRLEGRINEKLAMEIALEFLDANRAAAALETAMRRSAKRTPAPRRPSGPISRAIKRAPVVTAPNQMSEENRNAMAR